MPSQTPFLPEVAGRSLIILKYVNKVPSFASCSKCRHKFFTPPKHRFDPSAAGDYLKEKFLWHKCDIVPVDDESKKTEHNEASNPNQKSDGLLPSQDESDRIGGMKTSPHDPQCHEDRKAQKLLERIDKKLQEKSATRNSLQAPCPKQRPSAA